MKQDVRYMLVDFVISMTNQVLLNVLRMNLNEIIAPDTDTSAVIPLTCTRVLVFNGVLDLVISMINT